MQILRYSLFIAFSGLLLIGCAKSDEADSSDDMAANDNPYAAIAGDWMIEAYAADAEEGAEPLVVTLTKATDSNEGWVTKFPHLDDPVASTNVFMNGDSVVTESASFTSALREGEMVQGVTSYYHFMGDEVHGRFVATYENGDVLRGKLVGERVE